MAEPDISRTRSDLARALGAECVDWSADALAAHAHDTWPLSLLQVYQGRLTARPACVVSPTSTAQVVATLRYANEHRIPVAPFGGGSGVCGGVLPTPSTIVLDTRRMNRLLELNETALHAR